MQKPLSMVLVLIHVVPNHPLGAFVSEKQAAWKAEPGGTLAERLSDMSAEVAPLVGQIPAGSEVPPEQERLREKLRTLPSGTFIELRLRNGTELKGRLRAVGETELELALDEKGTRGEEPAKLTLGEVASLESVDARGWELPQRSRHALIDKMRGVPRGTKVRVLIADGRELEGRLEVTSDRDLRIGDERVAFETVERFFRLETNDWTAPEIIDEIPLRTEVDVRLENGGEVKSILVGVTAGGFALDRGTFSKTKYFAFEEVQAFRKHQKLARWAVWAITAGVVVGALGAYAWCADAGKCAK